jgi:hypothetical protein
MTTRVKIILGTGAGLCVFGLLFAIDPTTLRFGPPCMLYASTGLYCPGCGSTRALHQLSHGHLAAAIRFNPLAVVALPLLALLVVRPQPRWLTARSIWMLLIVVVAFGVLRNLPWYPWTLLAPQP